jgi:GAF domain-containing protein
MMKNQNLVEAASAFLGAAEQDHKELLGTVVKVAQALFGAAAASVFLLDEQSEELVFEAVAGEGEDHLIGERFPASRGIAGWVLGAQEPLIVSDLATNPAFAKDLAETTGYVPRSLMAAPLLRHDEAIGVMEVLDPTPVELGPLAVADMLTGYAGLAASALAVVRRNRAAHRLLAQNGGELTGLVEVARLLDELGADQREAGVRLLDSVHRLLSLNS